MPEPTPTPSEPSDTSVHPVMQTYQSDLSRALDTTDAKVVQELLATAREKETAGKERAHIRHQKGWYTAGGLILLLLAVAALGYGVYYYQHLTVPVTQQLKVGVFQSTTPVVAGDSSIETSIDSLIANDSLPEGKPFLVPLVSDTRTNAPLSVEDTFKFLKFDASEPFQAAVSLVRLGIINTGTSVVPFVIFSVPNPDVATKEFLIAEPTLLADLAPSLHINLKTHTDEIGKGFVSSYMYNLPVRSVRARNIDTDQETLLMYYGYATDHTIVAATNPSVLKAVYDTIIRQH